MNNQQRSNIKVGLNVAVVKKEHQRSGELTCGIVKRILTNSTIHPHGIKVMLESGEVGRVQKILQEV
ncbi:YwbE family protein [uncultured Draconibacterium sp.]|uniref:YwbE family protein n=1 Tax=uncultured Draconibacterium sp. TaxID=1573823 RepID=UPI0025ED65A5|nr:YwbE family protein [uncultured Draconibacterium sp.]